MVSELITYGLLASIFIVTGLRMFHRKAQKGARSYRATVATFEAAPSAAQRIDRFLICNDTDRGAAAALLLSERWAFSSSFGTV
jgi:hypothetical protein